MNATTRREAIDEIEDIIYLWSSGAWAHSYEALAEEIYDECITKSTPLGDTCSENHW